MFQRRLQCIIEEDIQKKMVLVAGPRQCGKTTLAKKVSAGTGWTHHYYNWDVDSHRRALLNHQLDASSRLWLLDEIHTTV